jgi:DNA/RNA-binding domain of Phe-tRNA-synthetase-like protein
VTVFAYDAPIVSTFSDVIGGVLVASGIAGGETPPALLERYTAEQKVVIDRIGETPLSQIESLAAWRAVFRGFGVDPTQYRSAAEALLRRLTKKGDIPSINTLVDIGNLVSIRYGLPVAVIDRRAIEGAIRVHFADGSEPFTNLGQEEVDRPQPGEVIFSDGARQVVARRWCWRQSDASAARPDSTDVVITIEAHHASGRVDVQNALADVGALLAEFAGGSFESRLLDREQPTF